MLYVWQHYLIQMIAIVMINKCLSIHSMVYYFNVRIYKLFVKTVTLLTPQECVTVWMCARMKWRHWQPWWHTSVPPLMYHLEELRLALRLTHHNSLWVLTVCMSTVLWQWLLHCSQWCLLANDNAFVYTCIQVCACVCVCMRSCMHALYTCNVCVL